VTGEAVRVEFFFAGGCSKCAEARDALREAAQSTARVQWKEIDIAREPNRAVDVGVVSTPAVAIDGELVFKTVPTALELQRAIQARLRSG
jgi:predicted thioredoxin/glutaredoxin